MSKVRVTGTTAILAGALAAALAAKVLAHCDTTGGPVIPEARAALEEGEVTPILKWIKQEHEAEIKTAFAQAVAVRSKGPETRELADQYFIETLVRLHRAGEGAPYTGIKAGPVEPVIAMADNALADGSADAMIRKISDHMAAALREKFNRALEAKKHKDRSVQEGREFVEAYVSYMHYVEGVHTAILSGAGRHHQAVPGSPQPQEHQTHP